MCSKNINLPVDSWERVCFMQHYGIKTRFLDWTNDFDIALFFAFEGWNPEEKTNNGIATVWVLDPNLLNTLSSISNMGDPILKVVYPKKEEKFNFLNFLNANSNDWDGSLAMDLTQNLISTPNKRIKIQKGKFTIHNSKFDLESELAFKKDFGKSTQKLYVDDVLLRIDLHPSIYQEVSEYLTNKNITHSTV